GAPYPSSQLEAREMLFALLGVSWYAPPEVVNRNSPSPWNPSTSTERASSMLTLALKEASFSQPMPSWKGNTPPNYSKSPTTSPRALMPKEETSAVLNSCQPWESSQRHTPLPLKSPTTLPLPPMAISEASPARCCQPVAFSKRHTPPRYGN